MVTERKVCEKNAQIENGTQSPYATQVVWWVYVVGAGDQTVRHACRDVGDAGRPSRLAIRRLKPLKLTNTLQQFGNLHPMEKERNTTSNWKLHPAFKPRLIGCGVCGLSVT